MSRAGTTPPRWNKLSDYLRKTFGTTVYRVGVDAGFGCPNRTGRGSGGCTFCSGTGARAVYQPGSHGLEKQIDDGIAFVKGRYGAGEIMLYFQAYSNTAADVRELEKIYDAGLSRYPFAGLVISTRPDCVDGEKADLIASYLKANGGTLAQVWVELGLQSVHDATLERIGRGHGAAEFFKARELLAARGVLCAAHIVFGLPGETRAMMLDTVTALARCRVDGVKFHDLHILKGTPLAEEMLSGELVLPCEDSYLQTVAESLELLPPETVIMRLTCDSPKEDRLFPARQLEKTTFANRLERLLEKKDSCQGRLFIP